MFNPSDIRDKFPQLQVKVHDKDLVYFDNAASTLRLGAVAERLNKFSTEQVSNVHRGAHYLSNQGTSFYENARQQVKDFVNGDDLGQVIFTRGTTEGINLVAASFVGSQLKAGDEILISPFEHHSNIVPWQQIAKKHNLTLKVMEFSREAGLTEEAIDKSFTEKTKFVSVLWYSNSFGHRLPVEKIVEKAHQAGARVLIDGAQVPLHEKIDVKALNCDFLVFSGHKVFAPYGIGALYCKNEVLDLMPPYQSGGSMIDRVTFSQTTFADPPQKYEAGTPNISGAVGLGLAVEWVAQQGVESWGAHMHSLRLEALEFLKNHKSIQVYDFPSEKHGAVVSFNYNGAHASDVGALLDQWGIAVRAGHHCTQPTMELLGIEGTVRISLAPYNTKQEVDYFCQSVDRLKEFF